MFNHACRLCFLVRSFSAALNNTKNGDVIALILWVRTVHYVFFLDKINIRGWKWTFINTKKLFFYEGLIDIWFKILSVNDKNIGILIRVSISLCQSGAFVHIWMQWYFTHKYINFEFWGELCCEAFVLKALWELDIIN